MATEGKKKITVDMKIDPYGEMRGKKPEWFALRPAAEKALAPIPVKRTMELDPRKWTKKDLEDGVYAVAKYHLAMFSTVIATSETKIQKLLPKDQKGKPYPKKSKDESSELKAALDTAEKEVKKAWKDIAKEIGKKLSLALDEVEADKGDNKAAMAAGKDALKKFDNLDTDKMFSKPTDAVLAALGKLETALKKKEPDPDAYKAAASAVASVKKSAESTVKTVQNVVKYLLHKGDKMSKDQKSDHALQNVGKLIVSSDVKPDLIKLSQNVDAFDNTVDGVHRFLKDGKGSLAAVSAKKKEFEAANRSRDGDLAGAVKSIKKVKDEFKKAQKAVK